jgi:hypothetical protein
LMRTCTVAWIFCFFLLHALHQHQCLALASLAFPLLEKLLIHVISLQQFALNLIAHAVVLTPPSEHLLARFPALCSACALSWSLVWLVFIFTRCLIFVLAPFSLLVL